MATRPSPIIRRYIAGYILRRRIVGLWGGYLWMIAIALLVIAGLKHAHRLPSWPTPATTRSAYLAISTACLFIMIPALFRLARRRNLVAAAMEIEQQFQQFDQRLITVASNPPESSLLNQIVGEVESIARDHRPKVSLRRLLAPVLAVIAAVLVLVMYP